jgi:uncharacterized protein (DUF362 family)
MNTMDVAVARSKLDHVEDALSDVLDRIAFRPTRDRVLLKPNIVVASLPENGDITHPKVVEALVRYFRKRGKEVIVAEGTGIFATADEFEHLLQNTGYGEMRERLDVPMVNLEQVERVKRKWPLGSLSLPALLRDYEYINVPAMKTHMQTLVSLGIKNQKGLIPMETKRVFHKRDLHGCIRELGKVLTPALTVMDGFYCIEGTGPTGPPVGEVKQMDLLVAGKDMTAVDNVCVQIMGLDVSEIRHLDPLDGIRVKGESIEAVRSPFKRPQAHFRRGPFVVHMDERACTMCTVSFYKAFSKIVHTPSLREKLEARPDLSRITLLLGPAEPQQQLEGCVLCIGDCASRVARKRGFPCIKGCHPDYERIVNFLFPGYYKDVEVAGTPPAGREKG